MKERNFGKKLIQAVGNGLFGIVVLAVAGYMTYTSIIDMREHGIRYRYQIGATAAICVFGVVIGGIYSFNALANVIEIISGNFDYESRHIRNFLIYFHDR